LKEAHRCWQYGQKGRQIIDVLSSLDKIKPSLDDTQLYDLENPRCGQLEKINTDHAPLDRFMDAGNDFLLEVTVPTHSPDGIQLRYVRGLPVDLIRKCCLDRIFLSKFEGVEFSQALTGIDYLQDLEYTRRTAFRNAARRLGIREDNWKSVLRNDPGALSWIEDIQEDEQLIEGYYAKTFVKLRVWVCLAILFGVLKMLIAFQTMVNELQSQPFYKPNVLAMLNTLFPPSVKVLPNERISARVLHQHRATFYQYLVAVERNGPAVLDRFISSRMALGTRYSWAETRQNLEHYVGLAERMIKQSNAVHSVKFFQSSWDSRTTRDFTSQFSFSEPSNRTTPRCSASTSFEDVPDLASSRPKSSKSFDSSTARARFFSRRRDHSQNSSGDYSDQPRTPDPSQTLPIDSKRTSFPERKSSIPPNERPLPPLPTEFSFKSRTRTTSNYRSPYVEDAEVAMDENGNFTRPISPPSFPPSFPPISPRSRPRKMSTCQNPKFEPLSEAAMDENFNKPIPPLCRPRPQLHETRRKRTISADKPVFPFQVRKNVSHQEFKSLYNQPLDGEAAYSVNELPKDYFEFLNGPYKPSPLTQCPKESSPHLYPKPEMKKTPSFGNFLRKKSSSNSLHRQDRQNSQSGLGIKFTKSNSSTKTESFPAYVMEGRDEEHVIELPRLKEPASWNHFSRPKKQEERRPSEPFSPFPGDELPRQKLKKQVSFSFLERGLEKVTSKVDLMRPSSRSSGSTFGFDETSELLVKKKRSLPSLGTLLFLGGRQKDEEIEMEEEDEYRLVLQDSDPEFVETHDPYQRFVVATPAVHKKLRKMQSESSMTSQRSVDSQRTITPNSYKRKGSTMPLRSIFSRMTSREGMVITSDDIKELFPRELRKDLNPPKPTPRMWELNDDEREKEYTRKWLLEEARAKRYDLNKPDGDPLLPMPKKSSRGLGGIMGGKKCKGEEEVIEMPRATPKPLVRPTGTRFDGIFHPHMPTHVEKKLKYKPIDISKYENGYLG
jgi:hypothetical protein